MSRLDPKIDFVFKQLLTRERVLLGDMLEGVLGRPLGLPTVVDAGIPGERRDDKGIALDVHAVLPDGSRANVEMQVRTSRTFAARLVFYGARNHSVQLRRGEGYETLTSTAVIAWVVKPLFPDLERLHTIFELRGLDTDVSLSGHLSAHLLQLSKPSVRSSARLPCYDAKVERWARFLNASDDAALDRLAAEDPIMNLATHTLDELSADPDVRFRAMRHADALAFQRMELLDSRREGREDVLLKLLGLRFGPVPAEIRARVEAATLDELDTWVERVLTAATLDDVLAPPQLSEDPAIQRMARDRVDAIRLHRIDLLACRLEAEAKLLLKQLGLRFGPLSEATRARVAAATPEQLDTWVERVLTAATLDEVLAP